MAEQAGRRLGQRFNIGDQLNELLLVQLAVEAGHDRLKACHDFGRRTQDRLAQVVSSAVTVAPVVSLTS